MGRTPPLDEEVNWDDLRLCLAASRSGSALGAARSLGLSHTTLLRRLAETEARLGSLLFTRSPRGLGPTKAGRLLVEAAEAMERCARAALVAASGRDGRMVGHLRI